VRLCAGAVRQAKFRETIYQDMAEVGTDFIDPTKGYLETMRLFRV